jgi:hypothetical protein
VGEQITLVMDVNKNREREQKMEGGLLAGRSGFYWIFI